MAFVLNPLRNFLKRLFGRWADNPQDQQYYLKMFFAIISALVCGLAGSSFAGIRGVMFGFLVYALSLYTAVYLLDINPEDVGGKQKLVTNTLVSYLMLWVLLWTLLYTFMLPQSIIDMLPIWANVTLSSP
jgi:hypothetical protein